MSVLIMLDWYLLVVGQSELGLAISMLVTILTVCAYFIAVMYLFNSTFLRVVLVVPCVQ